MRPRSTVSTIITIINSMHYKTVIPQSESLSFHAPIRSPIIATLGTTPARYHSTSNITPENNSPIRQTGVFNPIKFIPQREVVLQSRFGKFVAQHGAGLNVFMPGITSLIYVRTTENTYAVTSQEAITKDNASVKADGVIYYKIVDPFKAAFAIDDLENALVNLAVTNLRAVMGDMTLDDLLGGRKEINEKLGNVIGPATAPWGVEVTRVEIKDITPDRKLVTAMDQQMIAEREKRATILKAEADRNASILTAEGERNATVLRAEADKNADILRAEAKLEVAKRAAEALKVTAAAESNALEVVSSALQKHPAIANFEIAKRTADAWRALAGSSNNKLLLFPSGTNSIVTAVAAAAEMLGNINEPKNVNLQQSNRVEDPIVQPEFGKYVP